MQDVTRTLDEMKELYRRFVGQPAPELDAGSYVPFPPGVDPLEHAMREAQQLRELSSRMPLAPSAASWTPPADCLAGKDVFEVQLEVPGVSRKDIEVLVHRGECVIRGERPARPEKTGTQVLSLERPWGRFERRFVLPPGGRAEDITARCEDGVLTVRVPLDGTAAPRETKIEVS